VDGDNVVQGAPKDLQSRIKPIILDVTNTDDINAAVQTIQNYTKTSGGSFVGLVNNAGIQYHYPLEIQPGTFSRIHTSASRKPEMNESIR
jgi:NAD(P)-dependent dehydrogenase (short-subunit alcohol dehydrogenase family)